MKNIAIAWELGSNLGHVSRYVNLSKILNEYGYNIIFFVRDVHVSKNVLGDSYKIIQCPLPPLPNKFFPQPSNFAEILLTQGYENFNILKDISIEWITLFKNYNINFVIADYAPTALFAAYTLEIPNLAIGAGFDLPPNVAPFPLYNNVKTVKVEWLITIETHILSCLNEIIKITNGKKPLKHLYDIYSHKVILTYPELDVYNQFRQNEFYAGNFFIKLNDNKINWKTDKKHVFVYISSQFQTVDVLFDSLSLLDIEVIAITPNINNEVKKQFESDTFYISKTPISFSYIAKNANLVICNGGINMVNHCLSTGLPFMVFPDHMEQLITSMKLVELGVGVNCSDVNTKEKFIELLQEVLYNDEYKTASLKFAEEHKDQYSTEKTMNHILGIINEAYNK